MTPMTPMTPPPPPLRKEVPLRSGHTLIINRLPTSHQGELFFDHLVPALLPTVGEAMDKLAVLTGRVGPAAGASGLGLADVLGRLVPHLSWRQVQFLAEKALATSTINGTLAWEQRNLAFLGLRDLVPVTVKALDFHFGELIEDFIDALGKTSFLKRTQAPPASEGSPASTGPSGG